MCGLLMQAQQVIAPSLDLVSRRCRKEACQFGTRKNSEGGKKRKGYMVLPKIFCQSSKISVLPCRINDK